MQKLHESKKTNFLTENNTDSNRMQTTSDSGGDISNPNSFNGSGSHQDGAAATAMFSDNADDNMLENDVELSLRKRMYALRELISTEESYVQDLSLIVDGYIGEIRNPDSNIVMPDDLKGGKERMIFGNVEAIYEWHRE